MAAGDITEAVREIIVQGVPVRSGFRMLDAGELAGAVIELEFFVEVGGRTSRYLSVAGDRMRRRPGDLSFDAHLDGQPLADPCAGTPDMGGPSTVVEIGAEAPWRQPIVLNEFVALEHAPELLRQGEAGCLEIRCQRPLTLAGDAATALLAGDVWDVDVLLRLSVRRDDLALKAVADALAEGVAHESPQVRGPALARLVSMRKSAQAQLVSLADHADPAVAVRIRQCLEHLRPRDASSDHPT